MKKVMAAVATLLISTVGFASDGNLTKHALQSSISSAFKSKASSMKTQNDIHIVYGGEDVTTHHQLVNAEVLV